MEKNNGIHGKTRLVCNFQTILTDATKTITSHVCNFNKTHLANFSKLTTLRNQMSQKPKCLRSLVLKHIESLSIICHPKGERSL